MARVMATEMTIDSSNWRNTGHPDGLSTSEKVALRPGALSHVLPRWPRPAVWHTALTTVPWTASSPRAAAALLVEFVCASVRTLTGVIARRRSWP